MAKETVRVTKKRTLEERLREEDQEGNESTMGIKSG